MMPPAALADLPQATDLELPAENEEPQGQYGVNNRDLPKQLVDAIKAAVVDYQGQEKYTRRREVLHDRRNRFYERGYQHISWNAQNQGFTLGTPGAYITNSQGQSVQLPSYIDDYDLTGPYVWVLESVLTQNPPGVNFEPIDPSVSEDIDKANTAEKYARAFDRYNDVKDIQTQMVRMLALSGRTVSWTRTDQDASKFGYEPDGITPKSFQCTSIHGTLETKVAILAPCLRQSGYVFIYDDPDIKRAKDDYPWIKDKIRPNVAALGEAMYERTARLGVLNGTRNQAQIGDSFTHLVSRLNGFLRPEAFIGDLYDNPLDEPGEGDMTEPEDEGGEPTVMTVGEKLRQLFPHGCRAVFLGDEYAESFAEAIEDHIDIRFPFPGDGMFRKAIVDPFLVVQDGFNDMMNGAREKFDTGWGSLWVNAEQTEYDAINNQRAAPNAIRQKKARSGMKIEDEFFKEEDPSLPATFVEFLEMLQGPLPQFMMSVPPALFGAAMEDQKTASGYAQARTQAMGRQGLIWQAIQHMFARIRYQSALAASRSEQQTQSEMVLPARDRRQQDIHVDMTKLTKGNFGCYPDEDSSFPESTQQKRATLAGLIQEAGQSPAMQQLLDNPDNIEEMKRLHGFEELTLLPAEARNKQLAEIEELLKAEPMMPPPDAVSMAQQSGMPPPQPQTTVPIQELDYHQWEFEKCQEWLSSAARRAEDARGNRGGVQNVIAHALMHRAKLAEMQAAAAAMAQPPAAAPKGEVPKEKRPPAQPASAPQAAPAAPTAPGPGVA